MLLSCLTIQLYLDPNGAVPSVLSQVKGYVYALYAEDVIEVDIPYEPVGQWIDVVPDMEIQSARSEDSVYAVQCPDPIA